MAGCHVTPITLVSSLAIAALRRPAALLLLAVLPTLALPGGTADAYEPDHLMCGRVVERRTQTISIDPALAIAGVTREDVLAAIRPWNDLFLKYHGLPIFAEYAGDWQDADILITAQGSARTWVATRCLPGFVQRGANHTIVFVGREDAWRNRLMLAHELGHALGFADHGAPVDHAGGHVGFKPCSTAYMGVMSYCTGPQSWFLDRVIPGIELDGQLVAGYW